MKQNPAIPAAKSITSSPTGTSSAAKSDTNSTTRQPMSAAPKTIAATPKQTAITGLEIHDLTVGKGAVALTGKTVTVNYTGWLTNHTKFDSSLDPGRTPFNFTVGAGMVIPGWEKGVVGMKVGGKRRLKISPELAYGRAGRGPIPPNATLIFEIELLGVK
jgi:peptidylprolyl isomerase